MDGLPKTDYEFFLSDRFLPLGFVYPETYKKFVDMASIEDLEPWRFYYAGKERQLKNLTHLEFHFKGLQERYPDRFLVPCSRRVDCDDVACFDASIQTDDPAVIFIHDFASPGWEHRGECKNFSEWLEVAKKEAAMWDHYQKYGN